MASRNRPRGGMKDEERDMWNQLLGDIKRARTINLRCAETSRLIVALESAMSKCTFNAIFISTVCRAFLVASSSNVASFMTTTVRIPSWTLVDLSFLLKHLMSMRSMN